MVFRIPYGSSSSSALRKSFGIDRYEDTRTTLVDRFMEKELPEPNVAILGIGNPKGDESPVISLAGCFQDLLLLRYS